MAALLAPMPAAPPAPRDRSWVALITGAAALVSGVSVLLVGVVLSDSPSQPTEVPRTEVNPIPASRLDAARDTTGATNETYLLRHAVVRLEREHASSTDPVRVKQSGPGIVRADLQQKARVVRSCKGMRPESTHLATPALCRELRKALALMAAQHRGRVSDACPCPMGVPSYRSAWGNSDDRIANAQFGAASSRDIAPCVTGDLRQDLAQMASAQPISRCADVDLFLLSGRIAAAQNALVRSSAPYKWTFTLTRRRAVRGDALDKRGHRYKLNDILTIVDCSCTDCYTLGPAMRDRVMSPSRSPPPHNPP